jgi:putative tricarboxylic transport membrane protein
VNLIRSSVLGTVIGILPGAGSPIAAIISYNEAMRWSKDRASFGKGNIAGVIASETANNAAAPASMVPLLTLGIPGSSPSAVILGALLLHGLRPGADLYQGSPEIVFAFIWAMILGGFAVFTLGMVMTPALVRVVEVPIHALVPAITALTVVGSYAIRNNVFDVYLMFAIGLAGYLFTRVGVPVAPIALGLILGPIVESGLATSLSMADSTGMMRVFVTRPISALFIVLTIASVVWTVRSRRTGGALTTTGALADDADSVDGVTAPTAAQPGSAETRE